MPPTMWECETDIIAKLIRIVESALNCSSVQNSGNSSIVASELNLGEKTFAKRFLEVLISQNETGVFGDDGIGFTNGITNMNASDQNVQGSMTGSGSTVTDPNPGRSIHKLQNLEIIKVVVLIVVISIIMLTTCRMVFQLFIRFRPEKPQD